MKFKYDGGFMRVWAKVTGEGNNTTYSINTESDQGEPLSFSIIGELEFMDFLWAMNEIKKQYDAIPLDMKSEEKCPHSSTNEFEKTAINGVKMIGIRCLCGQFMGWKAQNNPPQKFVMPIGSHKGLTIDEICKKFPGYAKWASENISDKKIKNKFLEVLNDSPSN